MSRQAGLTSPEPQECNIGIQFGRSRFPDKSVVLAGNVMERGWRNARVTNDILPPTPAYACKTRICNYCMLEHLPRTSGSIIACLSFTSHLLLEDQDITRKTSFNAYTWHLSWRSAALITTLGERA